MPELPEVETVRRILSERILGETFKTVVVLSPHQVDPTAFPLHEKIEGKTVQKIERRGKFLIFDLDDLSHLVFHLRMEGKLFFIEKGDPWSDAHDRIIFSFDSGDRLIFNDTRRFGRVWYYPAGEPIECIKDLGPEANHLDSEYVSKALSSHSEPIKELLTDQTVFAGIGNIYADEICFSCGINPFLPAGRIENREEVSKSIAAEAARILDLSISLNGSTVKTYKASPHVSGSFQDHLMVYSREGEPCLKCGTTIRKRELKGRGTSFCPRCQHVPQVIGLTGGIASGKSSICQILRDSYGYSYISTDQLSKSLYQDESVAKELKKIDPKAFKRSGIDKAYLKSKLTQDKSFRHRWLTKLYSALKDRVIKILNSNPDKPFCIEAPLLFQAHLDTLCTLIVQARTEDPLQKLIERGDPEPERSLKLGETNQWQKYTSKCDAIISTDSPKSELKNKVEDVLKRFGLLDR